MVWMMMIYAYIHTYICTYRYPKRNVMIHESQGNSMIQEVEWMIHFLCSMSRPEIRAVAPKTTLINSNTKARQRGDLKAKLVWPFRSFPFMFSSSPIHPPEPYHTVHLFGQVFSGSFVRLLSNFEFYAFFPSPPLLPIISHSF